MIEKSDFDDHSKLTQSRRSPYLHTAKKEQKKTQVAFGRGTSNNGGQGRKSVASSLSTNNNDHLLRKFSQSIVNLEAQSPAEGPFAYNSKTQRGSVTRSKSRSKIQPIQFDDSQTPDGHSSKKYFV